MKGMNARRRHPIHLTRSHITLPSKGEYNSWARAWHAEAHARATVRVAPSVWELMGDDAVVAADILALAAPDARPARFFSYETRRDVSRTGNGIHLAYQDASGAVHTMARTDPWQQDKPEAILQSALREAVRADIEAARAALPACCALCGSTASLAVDHVIPFRKVADEWLAANTPARPTRAPKTLETLCEEVSAAWVLAPADATAWSAFHAEQAEFEMLCAVCNRQKFDRPLPLPTAGMLARADYRDIAKAWIRSLPHGPLDGFEAHVAHALLPDGETVTRVERVPTGLQLVRPDGTTAPILAPSTPTIPTVRVTAAA